MRESPIMWGLELLGVLLILFGTACLIFAPRVQRRMLTMAGAPRTRLAAWSLEFARSTTAVWSIRVSGLGMIGVGTLLCVLPFLPERM